MIETSIMADLMREEFPVGARPFPANCSCPSWLQGRAAYSKSIRIRGRINHLIGEYIG